MLVLNLNLDSRTKSWFFEYSNELKKIYRRTGKDL
jgi:hypothetical protein